MKASIAMAGGLFSLLLAATGLAYAGGDNATPALAPGYGALGFVPPAVGSYELPALKMAPNGNVLDESGKQVSLYQVFGDKIVVFSFIYSTCGDVNGCPLATFVLNRLKKRMDADPELGANVRLVTISFDPEHDTPAVMRLYAANFKDGAGQWRFLTTASQQQLRPILDSYGQRIQREVDASGQATNTFSHVLRVFLIDRQRQIRNIYAVSFLHPDLVVNDIKTILRVPPIIPRSSSKVATSAATKYSPAKLLARLQTPPLGLPPMPVPADNALSPIKVALGRKLFFDRRLSLNQTVSCAMCHIPQQGFTNNELATSVGIEGRTVRRNAPTLYNVGYKQRLFHDGRETALRRQIWGPLLNHNEMGNVAVGQIIGKIRSLQDYSNQFDQAFPTRGLDMETLGMAIASYERTLVSGNSPFDRWYYGGEKGAVSQSAKRGFGLFSGKAGCSACHSVGKRHALFTDQRLHNTGIGYARSMAIEPPTRKVEVAPGVVLDVATSIMRSVSGQAPADLGLYEVTQDPADRWKYTTPTLRNIALTAPYMHDGSLPTLRDVIEFYNRGGVANEELDTRIHPLHLRQQEIDDLVAFLSTLTGDDVGALVGDASSAPIGDPGGAAADGGVPQVTRAE